MSEAATGRGRFIVLEGVDGCGKSTQAARLADRLGALLTREPGATAVGARIRELLLHGEELDDRTEALLMAADRAQHVAEVVEPALRSGRHVVSDRYIGSSIAYQGYGRGLDVDIVRAVSGWAAAGLWPDLVVWLSVPAEMARSRTSAERDRIESAGDDFRARVERGFAEQAADEPDVWVEVDGTGSEHDVADRILAAVRDVLGDVGGRRPEEEHLAGDAAVQRRPSEQLGPGRGVREAGS